MALITIQPIEIEIDIPDLIIGTVTLKRKAKLFTMTYNQQSKYLALTWTVRYIDITAKGIESYSKESVADNTTMVDVQTGAILMPTITQVQDTNIDGTPKVDVNGNPVTVDVTTYPGDYIGQYDWFNMTAQTKPLKVHDLIRAYGLQANWN